MDTTSSHRFLHDGHDFAFRSSVVIYVSITITFPFTLPAKCESIAVIGYDNNQISITYAVVENILLNFWGVILIDKLEQSAYNI